MSHNTRDHHLLLLFSTPPQSLPDKSANPAFRPENEVLVNHAKLFFFVFFFWRGCRARVGFVNVFCASDSCVHVTPQVVH